MHYAIRSSRFAVWWTVVIMVFLLQESVPARAAIASLSNNGFVSGTISSQAQKDRYTFTANAGTSIVLRVARVSGSIWPALRVYGPAGGLVASTTGDGTISTFARNILTSGTYTVEITDTGSVNRVGQYRLYFATSGGAAEHGALINGGSRSQSIELGDLDSYTFTATQGESIMLRAARMSGNVWPSLRLYGPSGGLVSLHDGTGLATTLVRNILTSGTYTVVVGDGSAKYGNTGAYRLYFARGIGANEHGTLINGGTRAQVIDRGDLDSYTFAAKVGERVVLNAARVSGSVAPTIRLFGPTGLWLDTAGGNAATATMPRNILQSGTYVVVVSDGGSSGAETGDYTLSFTSNVKRFSYAALGDSYSSGEGLWPYLNPEDWYLPLPLPFQLEENFGIYTGCHRSAQAYPYQLKLPGELTPLALKPDVEFNFFACTGAETKHVRVGGESLQGEPPQLSAVNAVNANRDLVTVTIGGNDAQWFWTMAFCFMHNECHAIKPFAPYTDTTLAQLISPLLLAYAQAGINDVHHQIRSATPNAATVVFGYPVMVSGNECPALQIPGVPEAKLSTGEQAFLRSANIELNNIIAASAAHAGLHYISVANHFADHEVCDAQENWVNGFTPLNPAASFHPTARGQAEYARLFNDYVNGIATSWSHGYLANGLPRNPAAVGAAGASRAAALAMQTTLPRFGQLSVKPQVSAPNSGGVQGIIVPGRNALLRGTGYRANEVVTLSLALKNARIPLGHTIADANGAITASIPVPAALLPDTWGTVEALGSGQNGAGLLLMSLVRVAVAGLVDTDGDGIPDA